MQFEPDTLMLYRNLGTASVIGFLIGFEREWTESRDGDPIAFAGVRTFTLVAFVGALAGVITENMVFIGVIFAAIGLLTAIAYWSEARTSFPVGGTTEIALLATFLLGVVATLHDVFLTVVGGVFVTLLLSIKRYTEKLALSLSEREIRATLRFVIITVIVLPLVPDQGYGPYAAINPRSIWLMVVFISGLSFIGYWLMKAYGQIEGVLLTSLIGGLASSNATTISISNIARDGQTCPRIASAGVIIASAMMVVRVSLLVGVVSYDVFQRLWPVLLMSALSALLIAWMMTRNQTGDTVVRKQLHLSNPLEIKPAVLFALFLGAITVLAAVAMAHYGYQSLYLIALISGGVDVDAATIVAVQQAAGGAVGVRVAADAVLLAVATNLAAKAVISGLIAGYSVALRIAVALALIYLTGGLTVLFIE